MPSISDVYSIVRQSVQSVPGYQEIIPLDTPAAGALTVGRTVPGQTWEVLLTAKAKFTTDATAGNRYPSFELVDGNGVTQYARQISTGVAASSSITAFLAYDGSEQRASTGNSVADWPILVIPSGYTIQFVHNGIGAGDSWTEAYLWLIRIPTDVVRQSVTGS